LDGIPEAGNHWYKTYRDHHINRLDMKVSSYDSCVLLTEKGSAKGKGMAGLQVDDTMFLSFRHAEQEAMNGRSLILSFPCSRGQLYPTTTRTSPPDTSRVLTTWPPQLGTTSKGSSSLRLASEIWRGGGQLRCTIGSPTTCSMTKFGGNLFEVGTAAKLASKAKAGRQLLQN
jgi:hypothetical protein